MNIRYLDRTHISNQLTKLKIYNDKCNRTNARKIFIKNGLRNNTEAVFEKSI